MKINKNNFKKSKFYTELSKVLETSKITIDMITRAGARKLNRRAYILYDLVLSDSQVIGVYANNKTGQVDNIKIDDMVFNDIDDDTPNEVARKLGEYAKKRTKLKLKQAIYNKVDVGELPAPTNGSIDGEIERLQMEKRELVKKVEAMGSGTGGKTIQDILIRAKDHDDFLDFLNAITGDYGSDLLREFGKSDDFTELLSNSKYTQDESLKYAIDNILENDTYSNLTQNYSKDELEALVEEVIFPHWTPTATYWNEDVTIARFEEKLKESKTYEVSRYLEDDNLYELRYIGEALADEDGGGGLTGNKYDSYIESVHSQITEKDFITDLELKEIVRETIAEIKDEQPKITEATSGEVAKSMSNLDRRLHFGKTVENIESFIWRDLMTKSSTDEDEQYTRDLTELVIQKYLKETNTDEGSAKQILGLSFMGVEDTFQTASKFEKEVKATKLYKKWIKDRPIYITVDETSIEQRLEMALGTDPTTKNLNIIIEKRFGRTSILGATPVIKEVIMRIHDKIRDEIIAEETQATTTEQEPTTTEATPQGATDILNKALTLTDSEEDLNTLETLFKELEVLKDTPDYKEVYDKMNNHLNAIMGM